METTKNSQKELFLALLRNQKIYPSQHAKVFLLMRKTPFRAKKPHLTDPLLPVFLLYKTILILTLSSKEKPKNLSEASAGGWASPFVSNRFLRELGKCVSNEKRGETDGQTNFTLTSSSNGGRKKKLFNLAPTVEVKFKKVCLVAVSRTFQVLLLLPVTE